MAASGYSISAVEDIEPGKSVDNIILGKSGVKLREPSVVEVFLSREDVDVEVTVTIGGSVVFPAGACNINLVNDTLPSTQDDKVIIVMAATADEIIIQGSNANVAVKQLRALVRVLPIDDAILLHAARIRTGQ